MHKTNKIKETIRKLIYPWSGKSIYSVHKYSPLTCWPPSHRPPKTIAERQEDFDDVDESEIDYEGEEKAHDRVNQIPNSQVNRNQQNKNNSEYKDMPPRSES